MPWRSAGPWLLALATLPAQAEEHSPPAGLVGLLTPEQTADGPPGCVRVRSGLRWALFHDAGASATPLGWLVFRAVEVAPGDCVASLPEWEPTGALALRLVPTLESGYEEHALLVLAERGMWLRVGLGDSSGWLLRPDTARFDRYPDLLSERLTYATSAWSGEICDGPGADCRPATPVTETETPVEVIAHRNVAGVIWLEVQLTTDRCRDAPAKPLQRGWIPARDSAGRPTVWFHSRGC